MEKEYRKLSELRHWIKNPKTADRAGIDRLKEQIQLLGVYKPLMITPDGEVIGGNQRLRALQELGVEKAWVFTVDPKTEEEKVSLALSDNEQAGHYDEKKLYALLNGATNLPYHFFALDLGYTLNTPAPVDTTRTATNTVKEAHEVYLNNDEKQITLFFYADEYTKTNGLLKEAAEHYGTGNLELTVIALLDEFAPL